MKITWELQKTPNSQKITITRKGGPQDGVESSMDLGPAVLEFMTDGWGPFESFGVKVTTYNNKGTPAVSEEYIVKCGNLVDTLLVDPNAPDVPATPDEDPPLPAINLGVTPLDVYDDGQPDTTPPAPVTPVDPTPTPMPVTPVNPIDGGTFAPLVPPVAPDANVSAVL